ncbi:multidrug resistance-associated protein 4-like [Stylophora pistillata]|uniref:multidrug resistance-associated protein 4-like n=1 Tax=Stylophora pistillata TaxID=50429 RepID=UPI000C049A93|nr:multidrug resistance-associated protein 4-like [Stylophora pistillata]
MSLFEFGGTKPLQRQSANLNVLAKCKGNIFKFEGNRESSLVEEEDCDSLSEMEMEPVDSAPEQHVVEMKEQEENLMCVALIVPNWWLAKIAEMSNEKQKAVDTHVIYASQVAVSIIIMTASSFLFYYLLRASKALHNKMTTAIIKAPVSFFDSTLAGPLAGLALTYSLQSIDISQCSVRQASEVENLMTSVEWVMYYTKIGSEPGYSVETRPPQSWHDKGSLKVNHLSLAYYEGGPCVLEDISFSASEKEKIGIVGRTGAGKSSLVSALFRMPEASGKVIIDGIDHTSINLQEARRSIAVITQAPLLFARTLRRNLDPFKDHTDADLWKALENVQLKTLVEDFSGQLEFKLKESGANLSVGERQLVCLARALVQKSKIIVMDEASANVNFRADRLVQQVIRNKSKESTVLIIAHRLNTILDYEW